MLLAQRFVTHSGNQTHQWRNLPVKLHRITSTETHIHVFTQNIWSSKAKKQKRRPTPWKLKPSRGKGLILLQSQVLTVGGGGVLRSNVAEGLCIHTEGEMGWNWTEIRDHVTRWCQRKSVWCASSCHKCIDIRHRHSSPLSTEWLALVCFHVLF